MNNSFIVSSKGFLIEYKTQEYPYPPIFEWSHQARLATMYTSKQAKNIGKILDVYDINYFIWKPYEEIAGDERWVVIKKSQTDYCLSDDDTVAWIPVRRLKIKDSDIDFLNRRGKNIEDKTMCKEKAIAVAIKKNNEEYQKLINKISDLDNINEKINNNEY